LSFSLNDRQEIFRNDYLKILSQTYSKALAAAALYILLKIEIVVNKINRGVCSFLKGTNVSFQKGTTLKVDMKQVPVLQIYNKLQKEYVQIC